MSFDDLNDYAVGRGKLYFDKFLAGTKTSTGERYLGNTPTFSMGSTITSLDHFSSDQGVKELDKSINLQTQNTVSFSTDNLQFDNLALWFLGDNTNTTIGSATGDTQEIVASLGAYYQLGTTDDLPEGLGNIENVTAINNTGGTEASGTMTFANVPTNADTVTINGHVITFVSGTPTGAQVAIGGTVTTQATSLTTYIEANTVSLGVNATSAAGVVTVKANTAGTAGNSITLAKSGTNPTLSGATLAGGTAGTTITLEGNIDVNLETGRIQILDNAANIDDGDSITVTYDVLAQTVVRVVAAGTAIYGAMRYIADNATGDNKNYYIPYVKLSPDGDMALKGDDWLVQSFTAEALKKTPTTPRVIVTEGASQD